LTAKIEEAGVLRAQAVKQTSALAHSFLSELLRLEEKRGRWPFRPLREIGEINPGRGNRVLREDDRVTFVPMRSVSENSGEIVTAETRLYAEVKTGYTRFEDGDIIFARITPCMQNGKSAIAMNLTNGAGFGSTEFHVIRPGPNVEPKWLHYLVRHRDFLVDAAAHFTGTAGQQRVPARFMQARRVLVPPKSEQQRIVAALDGFRKETDELKRIQAETALELGALLPSILDKAFRGEL
jgi:type I restriction enzyme S subunit